ncbi:hypothetical protein NMG60_11007622 [Bertholletia excelsa]
MDLFVPKRRLGPIEMEVGCIHGVEGRVAAEKVSENMDMLEEILQWLPVKSLLQVRCVSKLWSSLISSPPFLHKHAFRNPRPSGLYFYHHNWGFISPAWASLDGHTNPPDFAFLVGLKAQACPRILRSCNGLLLCLHRDLIPTPRSCYVVCNPSTRKYRTLPCPSEIYDDNFIFLFPNQSYLAFDPAKSLHYKVLLFYPFFQDHNDCCIYIYSSQNGSWKFLKLQVQQGMYLHGGVYLDGAINWIISENNVHIQFDVEAEKFTTVPLSSKPKIEPEDETLFFGECGGHLLLVQRSSSVSPKEGLELWEMDRDRRCWIEKHRLDLSPTIKEFPEIAQEYKDAAVYNAFSVMQIVMDEKQKDFVMVLAIPGKIISYNFKCKTWKVLLDLGADRSNELKFYHWLVYPIMETLYPV